MHIQYAYYHVFMACVCSLADKEAPKELKGIKFKRPLICLSSFCSCLTEKLWMSFFCPLYDKAGLEYHHHETYKMVMR